MKIFLILATCAVVFAALVRLLEAKSVFYPSRVLAADPQEIGLAFEDVELTTGDGVRIHGWFIPSPGAKSTLVFFHGNAGNIGDRLGKIELFHQLRLNILIIDYRGYGKSQGRPTEQGVYEDALAAYDYVKNRAGAAGEKIIVYGASLGGAVAIDLASKKEADGLIVDSSFPSAADIAKRFYPFIPGWLLKTKFDSVNKIKRVAAPKLFIHSQEDEIVPYDMGRRLYDAAPPPKDFLEIDGGHNEGFAQSEGTFRDGIGAFLRKQNLI